MKWMFFLLCLGYKLPLLAAEQYSKFDCDNLKDRVEFIKRRASLGYANELTGSATDKELALLREYNLHCLNPVDTVRVIRGAVQESQAAEFADTAIQDMPSFSANNAIFQGEKATAWADFYQVPSRCRKKQLSESDFIGCAEHKSEQRAKFEQQWQTAQATSSHVTRPQQSTIEVHPARSRSVESPTVSPASVKANDLSLVQYWQALDEQNQRFKWYGLVMLLLMAIAGWLAWRT